jgi:membrane-associated phospholipid phosphatase
MTIWEIISMSTLFFTYLPAVLAAFATTSIEQTQYLTTLAGALATLITSEGLKKTLFYPTSSKSPLARPAAARNCNGWCNDGPQGGAPGFPSTHSATATYLALSYYNINPSNTMTFIIVAMWGLILYSRLATQCHSLLQVGVGTLLGYIMFTFIN